jgi:hypothetical protein
LTTFLAIIVPTDHRSGHQKSDGPHFWQPEIPLTPFLATRNPTNPML